MSCHVPTASLSFPVFLLMLPIALMISFLTFLWPKRGSGADAEQICGRTQHAVKCTGFQLWKEKMEKMMVEQDKPAWRWFRMHVKENSGGAESQQLQRQGLKRSSLQEYKRNSCLYMDFLEYSSESGRLSFFHHLMSAWETATRRWLRTTTKFCFYLDPKPWNKGEATRRFITGTWGSKSRRWKIPDRHCYFSREGMTWLDQFTWTLESC